MADLKGQLEPLFKRWNAKEPERIYIIDDGCGTGGWGISFDSTEWRTALGHDTSRGLDGKLKNAAYDVMDEGHIVIAVDECLRARPGWGWTKDFMHRSDVTVQKNQQGGLKRHFRCTNHGMRDCSQSLAVNLLDAYLQAIRA